jgi:hypothetical protein
VNGDTLNTEARFAIVPEWVLFAKIPHLSVRLYAVLARHADEKGVGAFPSRKRLGDLLDAHPTTVDRALGELVGIGAVSVAARFRPDGGRASNGYTLRVVPPTHQREGGSAPAHRPPTRQRDSNNENPCNENQESSSLPADAGEHDDARFPIELALSAALGVQLTGMTSRERGQWNLAIRELVDAGATAEQVTARCDAYRSTVFPTARLTPMALVRHWALCGAAVVEQSSGIDAWISETVPLLGRDRAHEVVEDMPNLETAERDRRHRLVDERFDELAREAA